MRYKLICLAVIVVLLPLAFWAQGVEPPKNRCHQHLEAAEKTPCADHGDETFCTHLPLMNIVTDEPVPAPLLVDENGMWVNDEEGHRVQVNDMVGAVVQYFDSETENNHLADEPTLEHRALIRGRGNSSREFDKVGYLLKFTDADMVTPLKVSLSGMTADNNWILYGPFLDKTLIRNYICYNLSGEIMDYAPNVRFCEMFLNGEYVGVYLITEKISFNQSGRITLRKTDPDMATTSYIVQADRGARDAAFDLTTFGNYTYSTVSAKEGYSQLEVIYPGATLTPAQREFIENDLSTFERALFSFDYNDPDKGYTQYIDVGSFIDYFLINEFTLNYDALSYSTYLYKDVGDRLKLCVWDFNSAFDYFNYSVVSPETFQMQSLMWYQILFKDQAFVERVERRYHALRERFFNEKYMFAYIDETLAYLGEAIDRNYEKWGYSFQSVHNGKGYDFLYPAERNVRSFDEAVAQLKECISRRIEHMDSNLERLYILCHQSMNKEYNYDTVKKGQLR